MTGGAEAKHVEIIASEVVGRMKDVSPTLATLLVKARMTRGVEEKELVEDVQRCLAISDTPALDTLRMQVAFDEALYNHRDEGRRQASELDAQREERLSEILALRGHQREDVEALQRLLAAYFALTITPPPGEGCSGMENKILPLLTSLTPVTQLRSFVPLPSADKKRHLDILRGVVAGLYAFNRFSECETSQSLEALRDRGDRLMEEIEEEKERVEEVIQSYEGILYNRVTQEEWGADSDRQRQTSRLAEEHANYWQARSFLETLAEDAQQGVLRMKDLYEPIQHKMAQIAALLAAGAGMERSLLYATLADFAVDIDDLNLERHNLELRWTIFGVIGKYNTSFTKTLHEEEVRGHRIKQQQQQQQQQQAEQPEKAPDSLVSKASDLAVLDSKRPIRVFLEPEEFHRVPLEFEGCCPWSIVHRNLVLLRGVSRLGIIHFQHANYCFSTEEALQNFLANPDRILTQVVEAARLAPQLIGLLRLREFLPKGGQEQNDNQLHPLLPPPPVLKVDSGAQTPTHFLERKIDSQYEWNEWELRRKALTYVNLRTKATHSMQTDLSHFRRDNQLQVHPPRDVEGQTGKNASTHMPRQIRQIIGLRGTNTQKMTVVNIAF